MIVTVARPARPYAGLSDLTTKAITKRGWEQVDGEEVYAVHFAVNLTAAEDAAIRRRLAASSEIEETLWAQGATALDTDRNFRDTLSAQLLAGANTIINDASMTSQEQQTYIRNLATAVRTLTNQVESLSRQNIGLIRLAQRLLDSTN